MTQEAAAGTAREMAEDQLSAELLQSVVDVARFIFGAQASSVFLLDEEAHELVFQAVSGQGEGSLVGRAFPAGNGIAGWVVMSGEPLVVDDLSRASAFDYDFAESTAYVPRSLMAAPLVHGGRVIGVLEVLDPVPQSRTSLNELELLAHFARQAAIGLQVVADRHAQARSGEPASPAAGAEPGDRNRAAALRLVDSLRNLLEAPAPGA
jgi:GAF domain-containing protein